MSGRTKTEKVIDAYVHKYAKKHKISLKEARTHEIVKNVIELYNLQEQRINGGMKAGNVK